MAAAVEIIAIDRARASAICDKIRENMTSARDLLVELYEGRGWEAMGYKSWRECVAAEFGQHERTLYKQLEAARVARELDASQDGLSVGEFGNKSAYSDVSASRVPDSQLVALAKAPEGTRAQVFDVAAKAADGKPTEKVVKAAVAAKLAAPEAPAETLVEVVKAAVVEAEPAPNAIVNGVPAYDAGVARAVAEGRIPAGVQVVVDDPGDAATDVADIALEHAERAAKVDDLTDDEWIARLPLAAKLSGVSLRRFRIDALLYRDIEGLRRRTIPLFSEARNRRHKGYAWKGSAVVAAVSWWFRMEHPKDWLPCPTEEKGGCGGSGTVPVFGGDCPTCKGRGYLAK